MPLRRWHFITTKSRRVFRNPLPRNVMHLSEFSDTLKTSNSFEVKNSNGAPFTKLGQGLEWQCESRCETPLKGRNRHPTFTVHICPLNQFLCRSLHNRNSIKSIFTMCYISFRLSVSSWLWMQRINYALQFCSTVQIPDKFHSDIVTW